MLYMISCLWSNELICFDSRASQIVWRRTISTRNEYDKLHSIRYTPEGWLLASTYTVYLFDHRFEHLARRWSHARLSNVHAVDWLRPGKIVVTNTGLDELLFCDIGDSSDLTVCDCFSFSEWMNLPPKMDLRDRRDEPRVKAADDHVHVNCATPFSMAGNTILACCLFHPNSIVFVDIERRRVIRTIQGAGERIHSAWISENMLFVCSSAQSTIKQFAIDGGQLVWEWTAPGNGWTRSAKLVDANTLVFTMERERDASSSEFLGYAGCLDLRTHEMQWRLDLPNEGPFDIEPFPNGHGELMK